MVVFNKTIQYHTWDYLAAWVDIAGVNQSIQENGRAYIRGTASEKAIVGFQYGIYAGDGKFISIEKASSPMRKFYYLNHTMSVSENETNVTAQLRVTLKWYVYCQDSAGMFRCGSKTETRNYYAYAPRPEQYPDNNNNITLVIKEYNNTFNPKTIISIPDNNYSIINYSYQNETIFHYKKLATVEQTKNGIHYANVSNVDFWSRNTETLHRNNNQVMIMNTSRPDYQNLTITGSNFFETEDIMNASVVRENYSIGQTFPKLFFAVFGIFGILLSTIYFIVRQVI